MHSLSRRFSSIWLVSCLFFPFSAFGDDAGKAKDNIAKKENQAYIDESGSSYGVLKSDWAKIFAGLLTAEPSDQTFGIAVFSSSGWADNGQRITIYRPDGSWVLSYGGVGSPKVEVTAPFKKDQYPRMRELLEELDDLTDVDSKAFDGIQYEVISASKKEGKVIFKKRIFMNNPSLSPLGKRHSELLDEIFKLEQQALKK